MLRLQVPMAGKGVVEALLAVLARVTGASSDALAVQDAACSALQSLTWDADNQVRVGGGVSVWEADMPQ